MICGNAYDDKERVEVTVGQGGRVVARRKYEAGAGLSI